MLERPNIGSLIYKWVKKKYIFIQSYSSILDTYTHFKERNKKGPIEISIKFRPTLNTSFVIRGKSLR